MLFSDNYQTVSLNSKRLTSTKIKNYSRVNIAKCELIQNEVLLKFCQVLLIGHFYMMEYVWETLLKQDK